MIDQTGAENCLEIAHSLHSNRILNSLLKHCPDAVFVFDREMRSSYANPSAAGLLHQPADTLIDKPFETLFPVEFCYELTPLVQAVTSTGKPLACDFEAEGDPSWHLRCLVLPIPAPPNSVEGTVVTLQDRKQHSGDQKLIDRFSRFDTLTGLPNRTYLERELRIRLAQPHGKLAVLIIDLDRFKNINDTESHAVGDQVLIALSKRLLEAIEPSGGFVGRLSGDKFMCILPDATTPLLTRWCRQILSQLQRRIPIGQQEFSLSATIGAAICPRGSNDASALLKNADIALNEAKTNGRSDFRIHIQRLGERVSHSLALEVALHEAVERQQFQIHYQPIVECRTGRISKAEALIRWEHPSFGTIGPSDFIPLSEASEDIFKIGLWLIEAVTDQLAIWQQDGLPTPTVAINLSPRQLNQYNLIETLRETIARKGLEPQCLEIEVTESTAIQETDQTVRRMHELQRIGIRTAIDDFGSGYASLSYLKRLPIDTIKIDKQFVNDCVTNSQDAAIIKAVIDLAHGLGQRVIAEGIEDGAQVTLLLSLGCDSLQGFLFSHPLPADRFSELLRQGPTFAMEILL